MYYGGMNELFLELHTGHPSQPQKVLLAVSDIRMIRAICNIDLAHLTDMELAAAYKTAIVFKGDGWLYFVHEHPAEVAGLTGIKVNR